MSQSSTFHKILEIYGRYHTPFIHGYGERGTQALLYAIAQSSHQHILEIGMGTGATLVKVKSAFPKSELVGIDNSALMQATATKRLSFSGMKNEISALHLDFPVALPNAGFDVIYAESVLGIQDQATLEIMIEEIDRLLQPGGRFICNETLFRDEVPLPVLAQQNAMNMERFGMVRACSNLHDFAMRFTKIACSDFQIQDIMEAPAYQGKRHRLLSEIRSSLFSYFGKLRWLFQSKQEKELLQLANENEPEGSMSYLSGHLIILTKR